MDISIHDLRELISFQKEQVKKFSSPQMREEWQEASEKLFWLENLHASLCLNRIEKITKSLGYHAK